MFIQNKYRLGVNMHTETFQGILMAQDIPFKLEDLDSLLEKRSGEIYGLVRAVNAVTRLNLDAKNLVLLAFTFDSRGYSQKADLFTRAGKKQEYIVSRMAYYSGWLSLLDGHRLEDIEKFKAEYPQLVRDAHIFACENYKAYFSVEEAVSRKAKDFKYL